MPPLDPTPQRRPPWPHPLELYGQDTEGFEPSNRHEIRLGWTCCARCHGFHRSLLAARLHWAWLWFLGRA